MITAVFRRNVGVAASLQSLVHHAPTRILEKFALPAFRMITNNSHAPVSIETPSGTSQPADTQRADAKAGQAPGVQSSSGAAAAALILSCGLLSSAAFVAWQITKGRGDYDQFLDLVQQNPALRGAHTTEELEDSARSGLHYERVLVQSILARAMLPQSALVGWIASIWARDLDLHMANVVALLAREDGSLCYQYIMATMKKFSEESNNWDARHTTLQNVQNGEALQAAMREAGVWRRLGLLADWLVYLICGLPGDPSIKSATIQSSSRAAVQAFIKQYPHLAQSRERNLHITRQLSEGVYNLEVDASILMMLLNCANVDLLCGNAAAALAATAKPGTIVGAVALRDIAANSVTSFTLNEIATKLSKPPVQPTHMARISLKLVDPASANISFSAISLPDDVVRARTWFARVGLRQWDTSMMWWPAPICIDVPESAQKRAVDLVQANTAAIIEKTKHLVASSSTKPNPLEDALLAKIEELTALCQRRNQQLRNARQLLPQEEYELAANAFFFVVCPNLFLWALRDHGLFPSAIHKEVLKLSETGYMRVVPAGQAAWTALAGWAVAADVDPTVSLPSHVPAEDALTTWNIFAERMLLVTEALLPATFAAVQIQHPGWQELKQVDVVKTVLGHVITLPEYANAMRQAMYTSLQATSLDPKSYEREPLFTWSRVVLQHAFSDPRFAGAICSYFDQQFRLILEIERKRCPV